jgi:hypothetical protein
MTLIEVEALRPFWVRPGQRVEVGERVKVAPIVAGDLLHGHRARLLRPADAEAMHAIAGGRPHYVNLKGG